MVLVSSADHMSASTTVHDRGKPSRAKPDERRSVQTFEAQAQRRGVPGDAREWQHTRHGGVHDHAKSETTELWRQRPLHTQPCEGEGSEWFWVTPDHAQRTRGSARGRANSSSESDTGEPWSAMASGSWSAMTTARQRKPLTNQGTTLQKTVCTARVGRD